MQSFSWKHTIRLNILALRLLGLWPKDNKYGVEIYSFYTVITVFIFIIGSVVFQVMYIILVESSLEALTEMMFVVFTKALVCLKALCLIGNMKLIKHIVKTLNNVLFQLSTENQINIIQSDLLIWKMTYFAFWSLALGTIIMWSILPVLDKSYKNHQLPFPAWYPYDMKKSPFYEITYVHQVVGVFLVGMTDTNMDALMAALMMFTGAQCDILCDNLRKLGSEDYNRKLLKSIKHHKMILSFADDSNKFFNVIVLGQFFSNSVNTAMAMYQLSKVAPMSSESNSVLFYVSAITVQLFIYCWFGNEVTIKKMLLKGNPIYYINARIQINRTRFVQTIMKLL